MDASRSRAEGALVDCIVNRLEILDLYNFGLSANTLDELCAAILQLSQHLKMLHLGSNQISGVPNVMLASLVKLEYLYLNSNQLKMVPSDISSLTNLIVLYLNNNQLTELPLQLISLTKLTKLYLENNRITSVPNKLASLQNLNTLCLYGNPNLQPLPLLRIVECSNGNCQKECFQFLNKQQELKERQVITILSVAESFFQSQSQSNSTPGPNTKKKRAPSSYFHLLPRELSLYVAAFLFNSV